ncbi:MAG: GTPase family protein [Oscillatoriales cyanobacterium SM2_3_0]|nr:GTPase family protein [Oscillatoriales cyanobacterium SM2_3_0]
MIRLKPWQLAVLGLPIALIVTFLLIAAGWQIHAWRINWIWGIFTLVLVGWRWLLVKWTKPMVAELEQAVAEVNQEIAAQTLETASLPQSTALTQLEVSLQEILQGARHDLPIWEDWGGFWQCCQDVVVAVAQIYHPEVKYPLLNIYVPQAYGLIRGTMDDLDQWMQKLSPTLNQVTVGQVYQGYEVYRQLEPSARKFLQVWGWAQWVINPAAAVARRTTKKSSDRATQELLVNLGQALRETALRTLCQQAIALYSGEISQTLPLELSPANQTLPKAKTQTLREILTQADPIDQVEQKPVNILLVGRTGAGKSSLINTLFQADLAEVDVLPSTDQIKNYHWQSQTGEQLTLWDSPGYEQINRTDLREMVLDYANTADLLLLVTPALDPALQMDVDFLQDMATEVEDLPTVTVVTQVDRLRPIREWSPPYDWQFGQRPKEMAIRDAIAYRAEQLGEWCDRILPIVTADQSTDRASWNLDMLSILLVEAINPTKQLRLARFLRNLEARTVAAAKIIDHYMFQMATTQGLTALLKSPVLQFIATLTTGSPNLAYLLAEQIPIEQLPVVVGKLQMAYDLFNLFKESDDTVHFDLLTLWPLLLENLGAPDRNAWAFGHALVEYLTQRLTVNQLRERFHFYLEKLSRVAT